MRNNRPLQTLFVLATAFLFASSCGDPKAKDSEEENEITHEISLVEKKEVVGHLTIPGELEGYFETGILAKVNGYVKSILVDIGDKVSKDQLLVILEAPELMSQLQGLYSELQVRQALYLNTKGKYARLMQTNKTPGAVSPYDMDFASTTMVADSLSLAAATSKYESTKNLTDYLRITAPFEGIITERFMAPGAFVGPADKATMPILRLKSEDRLRLHLAVPEKHLAEVKKGDEVEFTVKSFPDKKFKGKITRQATSLNTLTRSEIVEVEIDNRNHQLLPGMYASAIIPIKRSELSIVVPQSSVIINMEHSFVIKIDKQNKAVWVDVEKGESQGDMVEVFGKLTPGDAILNVASDEIKNGETLKVMMVENKVKNK